MNYLVKLILFAIVILLLTYALPGVWVASFSSALIVAFLLSVFNSILKPILIILTIPITILTFGIFLLIINVLIVDLVDSLVDGFRVDGFWWALLFSLILSIFNSYINKEIKAGANKG